MRLSPALLGQGFGHLAKYRNIVECRVSSYELNPLKGMITNGVPNMARRVREEFFTVATPMVLAYMLYDWAEAENARLSRKNPKDYENDV